MKKLSFGLLLFTLIQLAPQARANCDFGQTIFRDSLYGGLIGATVGALFLVANQSSTNVAPALATGALIGIGGGLVTGIVESSVSDCFRPKKKFNEDEGFSWKLVPMSKNIASGAGDAAHAQYAQAMPLNSNLGEGIFLQYNFR